MGILNPVVSKFSINTGNATEIYYCPAGKSHAVVDVSVLKASFVGSSLVGLALSTSAAAGSLTSVDFFIDDIELLNTVNSVEVNKIIVGQGQRLYAKLISGDPVNIRLSGVEENNASVLAAGRLAAMAVANTNQTKVFENLTVGASYVSGSLTLYNAHATNQADVSVWITSGVTPTASDKCSNVRINPTDTVLLENLMMSPNEKIFVESTQLNGEYFLVGMVVSGV
ncbi:hypothetical protein [Flavobacterium sp.]|jgi:hypothetical protein|uniref:hypothetical protein n=1 Tax=Flavobacterium sp. TaxID=239 RepID=UPI0037BEA77F